MRLFSFENDFSIQAQCRLQLYSQVALKSACQPILSKSGHVVYSPNYT